MTCDEARAQLLELPLDRLGDLPHLATCPDCRALAEALLARHAALDRALDAAPPLPLHLGPPEPANSPWRWTLSSIALTAAVAATLALGARTLWTPPPTSAAPVSCELARMEPRAVEGKLTPAEITCLEKAFAADPTTEANRAVMVHHFTAGDLDAWEASALRQVRAEQALGAVDPNLAYKLALHFNKTAEHAQGIEMAELALDAKSRWIAEDQDKRHDTLLKLVAAAREGQWTEADQAGGDAAPARVRAEQAALTWLEHGAATGQDTRSARALCERVATDPSVCR